MSYIWILTCNFIFINKGITFVMKLLIHLVLLALSADVMVEGCGGGGSSEGDRLAAQITGLASRPSRGIHVRAQGK